jgi:heme-degrading monooxygenase HmoA
MERKIGDWRFVVIWEFQVRLGQEERFEQVCGADGVWAQFFRQDEAYVGTDLIRGVKAERTYLTLDFWKSQEAYDAFRSRHAEEYKAIDTACESMTESEREVGRYSRVSVGQRKAIDAG